ncbi:MULTISPECIES: hypothetical protein [Pasteurellaceae]|uniref:Uncharacterized protein n=1 Tax=Avibacterium paragallinarum TaxID=728 RepID=A0ABU7QSG3_AVIPA|nr:hypothetical protein [Avibacterium paragallinarum]
MNILSDLDVIDYAKAVIVAFERKKPITAQALKVRQYPIFSKVIEDYSKAKNAGVDLERYLAEYKGVSAIA